MSNHAAQAVLIMNGLSCANCARKIEAEIRRLSYVQNARIDFARSRLVVSTTNGGLLPERIADIQRIAQGIEPSVSIVSTQQKKRAVDWKRIVTLCFSSGIFLLALMERESEVVTTALFSVAYLLAGRDVIHLAIKNLFSRQFFDENFLMTVATLGAIAIGEFPEAVAVMLFYKIGEFFQHMAVSSSRRSIANLMDIRPEYANLKRENALTKVRPEEVKVGDTIVGRPGERIPLDGVVTSGTSEVDTSALTGESTPRTLSLGDSALAGYVLVSGSLTIQVEKEYSDSTVAKILNLVEHASANKSRTEDFITDFSRIYTPIVVLIALVVALIPPILFSEATFAEWTYRGLVFLVISCPCALVVSIPLTFFGGIGTAARSGILVKGSNFLDGLSKITQVVFDKTGTITEGSFQVAEIHASPTFTKQTVLETAATVESLSNHPIARSISSQLPVLTAVNQLKDYQETPGKGVQAEIGGQKVIVGSAEFLKANDVEIFKTDSPKTSVHVAIGRQYAGYIIVSDVEKKDAKTTVSLLKQFGIRTMLLTGDRQRIADEIAKKLGFDEVFAEKLPHEKVEVVEALAAKKTGSQDKVVYVGDGLNDAPVLARSDIGVAMGALGSDAAIEAADVVIMTDEPSKLVTAIQIARQTKRIVWQNVLLALSIKVLFMLLGTMGIATLWEAVFADVGVTLLAIVNSMRALKRPVNQIVA